MATVIETFRSEFPNSYLWYNSHEFLIIGRTEQEEWQLTEDALNKLLLNERVAADLAFSHWGGIGFHLNSPETLLGCLVSGPDELSGMFRRTEPYRDTRPWLEYSAASQPSYEIVKKHANLLARHLADLSRYASLGSEELSRAQSVQRMNISDLYAYVEVKNGFALLQAGSSDAAELFGKIVQQFPERVKTWVAIGLAAQMSGQPDQAVQSYEYALRLDPLRDDVHSNLASLFLSANNLSKAKQHASRAVEINARSVIARSNLGLVLAAEGKHKKACEQFRAALEFNPNNSQVLSLLRKSQQML